MKKEIEKIVKEFNLINRAEDSFWKSLKSYREEAVDEYNAKISNGNVTVLLKIIAYKLLMQNNIEIIEIKLDVLSNDILVGDYSLIVDYHTKDFIDDYFVFY